MKKTTPINNATRVLAKRTTRSTIIERLNLHYSWKPVRNVAFLVFVTAAIAPLSASAGLPPRGHKATPRAQLKATKKVRTVKTPAARLNQRRIRARPSTAKNDRDLGPPYDAACSGVQSLSRRDGKIPFNLGEELGYELTVGGAYVGRMETKVGRPRKVEGKPRLVLFGRARTNQLLTALKPFAGRYMAMVDPQSLWPLGVRTELTYGTDSRWERIRFEPDHRGVRADYLLKGNTRARQYKNAEHDLTDVLTLLYVARTVELGRGLEVCQDVFGARRLWRMTAAVEGSRPVRTPAGEMDTWFVRSVFDRKPTPGLSRTKRPRIEMDVFLAKDETQAPLRFVVRMEGIEAVGRLVRWSTQGRTSEEEWGI